ncbi:penicillin-binding protein activator [Actibacterium sp. XHP0104]|uniref:penicillin-binding protein activator n=1 Tax=Actibacterium sp. XHP0104 TaxID=2984335 RepID=UPI0021E996E8|nr:penicillin-binding protein activator [Actibacterium sp. XHP0104]MCV2882671.1 penicillin-binding protein activator [Actibacterium sp. XHP0104]
MFAVFRFARKPLRGILVFLTATLALAACQPVGNGPSINTRAAVPVALLVPSGSGQSGDEVLAQGLEAAARLAIADLDGIEIDLRVYSTAGNPEMAAQAAKQAVGDGAKIILGPVYAQSANAAGLAVASRGVNVLSFSNNTDIAGGNVFVMGPTFENTANRLVGYAARSGRSQMMVLHDQNVAGQVGAAAVQAAALRNGAQIVAVDSYEFSQNGVVQAIPRIADTVRATKATALLMTADSAGALPLVTQLLVDNRISPETIQFIGLTRWDIPASNLALPGVQGGWFALPDPGLNAQFSNRYQAAYGSAPHPIAGLAYDGIAAIGALVTQGKSDALTKAALTQGAGFVGVNGIFRLMPDGTNERGLAVAEIRDNQVFVIDPAPRNFGGIGF